MTTMTMTRSLSLMVVYGSMMVGGFFTPYIVRRLGNVTAMVASAATYTIFVASFIYVITPWLIVASALNGFCGSVLWTAQGMVMAENTTDANKSQYFSLFLGIFSLMFLPGNLVSHYLLDDGGKRGDQVPGLGAHSGSHGNHTGFRAATTGTTPAQQADPLVDMAVGWDDSNSPLFVVLTLVGAVGVLTLLLFKPPDPRFGSPTEHDDRGPAAQARATFGLLFTPKLGCLVPLFVFIGVQMVMWASWFPRQMHSAQIGLVMPVTGAAAFLGGLTVGPLIDGFGVSAGVCVGCGAAIIGFACTWMGNGKLVQFCQAHAPLEEMPCKSYDG